MADGVADIVRRDAKRPVRVATTTYFADSVIFPRIAEFWRANDLKLMPLMVEIARRSAKVEDHRTP